MPANLVQLKFKPGILRDGSKFQGNYCTDSQWVRFQRGTIKKIGGLVGQSAAAGLNLEVSDILISAFNATQADVYLCANDGIWYSRVGFNNHNDLVPTFGPVNILNGYNNPNVIWQSQIVTNAGQKVAVFLATNNGSGVAQNSASALYSVGLGLNNNTQATLINNAAVSVSPLVNGGMCYAAPYLFLYGSNGFVQYSRNNSPLLFNVIANDPTSGGSVAISNDKVLFGNAIRGGSNSPSVLFWTLSSVVRITNVGEANVAFKVDPISTSSSILSSKCVVEYDGLFFWPGTDRFFVYNGAVQEMVNPMNLNYFFDNLDMAYRQRVFGVKNTKYGELWWFYPEKLGSPRRPAGAPIGTCTRALIYNKRENTWYDTAIARDAGTFSNELGILMSYGKSLNSLTAAIDTTKRLWRHEINLNEVAGAGVDNPIISNFTTQPFGLTSFSPNAQVQAQLIDRFFELRRIEPDFQMTNGNMQITANTQRYPQSAITSAVLGNIAFDEGKMDVRVQGRIMSLSCQTVDNFELGNVNLLFNVGDGQ